LADAQLLRHLVDGIVRFFPSAHVDGESHAVRGIDAMVLMVNEQELVAFARIGQADSTGIAGLSSVGSSANRALPREFFIGKLEQMVELLCR
jgi:hypothetical protein